MAGAARRGEQVDISFDLPINAVIAGILLGGFYTAVTLGVSISFGILDIVNIAHPAFIILGSYIAYIVNTRLGIDPIAISIIMLPVFYLLGAGVYQVYYESFERRGQEALRGLSFFFGLLFVTEVMLILVFGVDYRYVEAPYIGPSWRLGVMDFPLRMVVPCIAALVLFAALQLYLSYTFIGRAITAVAQDQLALRLMGASPSASSASPSAFPLRLPRSPALCSSSSNRSSRRSDANISGASLRSACSAGSAAFPAR